MQLENYFDFLAPDDIRLKGHRIGIESVLYEYIFRKQAPEAIARRFPSLSLEQIYATILYYLQNRAKIDAYKKRHLFSTPNRWRFVALIFSLAKFLELACNAHCQHSKAFSAEFNLLLRKFCYIF